jgi:hypothetical protein
MSNVRISDEAHSTLRGLADLEGQTMQAVLDKAVECYRRSRFWNEVETTAANLRSDPAAWNEELAERQAWDATLADGLDAE